MSTTRKVILKVDSLYNLKNDSHDENTVNRKKDVNPCKKGKRWERGSVCMMGGPHVMIVKVKR